MTAIPGRRAIRGLVAVLVALAASACVAGSARSAGTETLADSPTVAAGQLARGASESHPIPIDVGMRCMFLLLTTGGDVELVMTSPSGKRWSSHHPAKEDEGGHFSEDPKFQSTTTSFELACAPPVRRRAR